MMPMYHSDDTDYVNVMKDLFKYYRQKMNWEHYIPVVNEEPALTEELVEELQDEI
jgi:hypothetical protein